MADLIKLRKANAERWTVAKSTRNVASIARELVAPTAKARYQDVSAKTGVPWYFIAVAHERESSQNWKGSLAQGDPWDEVSVHVPAGRGPFTSWEAAAVDALVNCAPFAARNKDWSPGGLLTMLEEYNGLGYASRGVPSPYVWAGTDQYHSGKYVRDGVYDPNVVDRQAGCAGLLLAMMALDKTIDMDKPVVAHAPVLVPSAPVPQQPSITSPSPGSIGAAMASIVKVVLAFFKKDKQS